MKLLNFLCSALLGLLLAGGARSEGVLVVDAPPTTQSPTKVTLKVADDGLARLRLKWSGANDGKERVDFSLSPFKASGQPDAAVGLESGAAAPGAARTRLQQMEVSAQGTELLLSGASLTADVSYVGELAATVGQRQTLLWEITLLRPGAVSAFRCPAGAQIVGADGSTAIAFPRSALLDATTVDLRLSPFISPDKELGQVGFAGAEPGRGLQSALANVALQGPQLVPALRTVGLTEGSTYSGRLSFIIAARTVAECPLELTMPKLAKGELMTDITSLTRTVTLPLPPPFDGISGSLGEASLSLRLFEKSRLRRIDGITAVIDGTTASPNGSFEPSRHLAFRINDTETPDFLQFAPSAAQAQARAARTLEAGEQMNVEMRFKQLGAGAYTFALRFVGANGATPSPKVDITLNVRHHWGWAVAAVMLALLVSFVVSKGIVNWRERLRIRRRVWQLKQERFDRHIDIPAVAFLHVVLEQTTQLVDRSWFLAPPPSVNDFLARAERVASVMRRYSAIDAALDAAVCANSVKDHYREEVVRAMGRIGPQPLDQATTDKVVEDMGVIAAHLADNPGVWYWTHLTIEAKGLAKLARNIEPLLRGGEVVSGLLSTLETPPTNGDPGLCRAFDDAYWMIKVLVSRYRVPGANEDLISAYRAGNRSVAQTFVAADAWAWQRLHDAVTAGQVVLEPLRQAERHECLSPITFVLRFEDRALAESYLVCNVLKYRWRFTMPATRPARRWWQFPSAVPQARDFNPTMLLSGPRVTQDAPFAGPLTVGVTIQWPAGSNGAGEQLTEITMAEPLKIDANSELSLLGSLDGSERALMLFVTVITLVTALPTLYFAKASFGSFGDYIAILAWAIGVDQGKNLLQMLRSFPADAPTSP